MKQFSLILLAMLIASISVVGCKKKTETPAVEAKPEAPAVVEEVVVENPLAGKTFVGAEGRVSLTFTEDGCTSESLNALEPVPYTYDAATGAVSISFGDNTFSYTYNKADGSLSSSLNGMVYTAQ